MKERTSSKLPIIVSIVGVVSLAFTLVFLRHSRSTRTSAMMPPPSLPVVSACKEVAPGMKRIGAHPGDRYMLQFDVAADEVRIREGVTDAPPVVYGFSIGPPVGESVLAISYGPLHNWAHVGRERAASSRIVKRLILDDHGHSVGEDDWGYLDPERRWRQTRFNGWVQAEYGYVNAKDAGLFDQIISSACLLPN